MSDLFHSRPAAVQEAESLDELLRQAKRAVEEGAGKLRVGGELLHKARLLCPKGQWVKKVQDEYGIDYRHAARLIRAYRAGFSAARVLDALAEPVGADDDGESYVAPRHISPDMNSEAMPPPEPIYEHLPKRMGWSEREEFARGHVPPAPVEGRVGEPLTGSALLTLADAAVATARRLREDVDLFHAHAKAGPTGAEVQAIVDRLVEARRGAEQHEE